MGKVDKVLIKAMLDFLFLKLYFLCSYLKLFIPVWSMLTNQATCSTAEKITEEGGEQDEDGGEGGWDQEEGGESQGGSWVQQVDEAVQSEEEVARRCCQFCLQFMFAF